MKLYINQFEQIKHGKGTAVFPTNAVFLVTCLEMIGSAATPTLHRKLHIPIENMQHFAEH